jgi:uncharacterized protein (DUF4415 family)
MASRASSRLVTQLAESAKPMKAEYDFSKARRGAVIPQKGKTRISIFIDNATLTEFRARAEKAGTGYQTMMNEALRAYLSKTEGPVTEGILRNVLRQEIPGYLRDLTTRSRGPGKVAGRGGAPRK